MKALNFYFFEKKTWLTAMTIMTILGSITQEMSWAQTSPNSVAPPTPAELAEVKLRFTLGQALKSAKKLRITSGITLVQPIWAPLGVG